MLKKNIVKILIIIGVIAVVLLILHLVGGNLMNIIKGHMGI